MNHAQSAKFETKVRFRKRSFTSWKKMRNQSIQFTCIVIIITTYLLPHLQFTLFVFSLGRCVSSHNAYYIVACEQALMTRVSCPRGDLRQVGKRFAGGLALDPLAGSRCSRLYRKRSCRSANNYIAPRQNTWPDEWWPQSSWKVSLQILVTFTSCSKLLHDLSWKF